MVRQATNYSPMKSTVKRPNAQNIRRRNLMDVDPIFDPRLVYQDIPDFLGMGGQPSPPKRPHQRPPIVIRRPPTIAPPLPVVRQDNVGYSETVYNYELDAPAKKVAKVTPKSTEARVRVKKEKLPPPKADPIECPRPGCGKRFFFQKVLDKHLLDHDVEKERKIHTCPHCQKEITSMYRMKIHIRLHTGEKPFYCEFCKVGYSDPRIYKNHMKTHEGQILYRPRVPVDPREEKVERVKTEPVKKDRLKKFKCTHSGCKKKFDSNARLVLHVRIHTGEKPFACTQCEAAFRSNYNLTLHTRLHTGEKPYECEMCPQAYPRLDSLRYHMKTIHGIELPPQNSKVVDPSQVSLSDDAPPVAVISPPKRVKTVFMKILECSYDNCDKKFTSKSAFDKHICTHTGEKRHVCEVCQKGFVESYGLKLHMRVHTGEKPYRCDKCPEMFSRSDGLRRHLKKHIGEKTVNCGICGDMFETNEEKSAHVIEKHMPEKLRMKREAMLTQKAAEEAQKAAEEAQKEAEKAEKEAAEAEKRANEESQNYSNLQNTSKAPLVGTSGPAFQWN